MDEVNCIVNDVKLKDDEFNIELPISWAELTFENNHDILNDFEILKNNRLFEKQRRSSR
ncbi:hypothetical protein DFR65_104217 [Oceanihabitans sediminis]|nr:hypothetical protein DFR65_104217 [Oceanihabitans sediminis]